MRRLRARADRALTLVVRCVIIGLLTLWVLAACTDSGSHKGAHCVEEDVGAHGQAICVEWDR